MPQYYFVYGNGKNGQSKKGCYEWNGAYQWKAKVKKAIN